MRLLGDVNFKSVLSIEEVGKIIGDKVFAGVTFGGLEEEIYEEVPAIYIDGLLLGFMFVIQGYPGIDDEAGYVLEMKPSFYVEAYDKAQTVDLSSYLYELLKDRLEDHPEIIL